MQIVEQAERQSPEPVQQNPNQGRPFHTDSRRSEPITHLTLRSQGTSEMTTPDLPSSSSLCGIPLHSAQDEKAPVNQVFNNPDPVNQPAVVISSGLQPCP